MVDRHSPPAPGAAQATPRIASRPLFEPVQSIRDSSLLATLPAAAVMGFVARVHDVARGVALLEQFCEWEELNDAFREGSDNPDEEDARRVLDLSYHTTLRRLAVRSLEMLSAETERFDEWAHEWHSKKGDGGPKK